MVACVLARQEDAQKKIVFLDYGQFVARHRVRVYVNYLTSKGQPKKKISFTVCQKENICRTMVTDKVILPTCTALRAVCNQLNYYCSHI